MRTICLMTDFGTRDGYPAAMKGVILSICPDARIMDITHEIGAQNVMEGALTLRRVSAYYPAGTIFVAVVDPGVGTQRRPVAARIGDHYFVGPDNGLFGLHIQAALQSAQPVEMVRLDRPAYLRAEISSVFHGRDIFAPVGAHLACGIPLAEMGSPVTDPVNLEIPAPRPREGGLRGQVVHVDHFGSLATNITGALLPPGKPIRVRVADQSIPGLVQAFGDAPPGSVVALIDSDGALAVAVVNGSAAQRLRVDFGEPVEVDWND